MKRLVYVVIFIITVFLNCSQAQAAKGNNEFITPEQYGAVGDGIVDDTEAFQKTFAYACENDGIVIKFGKNKNYLLSSGITLPKTSIVEGNNSKITVKEIKDFRRGGNYTYQFFAEYSYNVHSYLFDWKDLTIDFSPSLLTNEQGQAKGEYLLFRYYDLECFRMNNVKIVSNGDERNKIILFKFTGQGEIYMDDCSFDLRERGYIGGILAIQSTLSGGYFARINRTSFFQTGTDEIISIFCTEAHDVIFEDCKIEKNFYDTYYDQNQKLIKTQGPFLNSIYQKTEGDRESLTSEHHVTYKNCEMKCKPINANSDVYIPFCGLNSYYGDTAITNFINCDIEAYNISSIGSGEQAVNNQFITNIPNSKEFYERIKLSFDNCNIIVLTGEYGLLRSNSSNLEITNSNIMTNRMINYKDVNVGTVTSYQFQLINNVITMIGADNYLFVVNKNAKEQYHIVNNSFIIPGERTKGQVSLLKEENTKQIYDYVVFSHKVGSFYNFFAEGNMINGIQINNLNHY